MKFYIFGISPKTAWRRGICTPILDFCLNCLAVINFRQATRTILGSIVTILGF